MMIVLAVLVSAITALPASAAFPPRSSGEFSTGTPAAYTGECTSPADLDALPSAHWCEVPNSELDDIKPAVQPYGLPFNGVMYAWSGGDFDTAGNRLLIQGCGHNDCAINAVYGFDLDTFAWSEIFPPSVEANIQPEVVQHEVYLDGTPSALHSYGGLVYDPTRNDLYRISGSIWRLGQASNRIWSLDLDTNEWAHLYSGTDFGPPDPYVTFAEAELVEELDAIYIYNADTDLKRYDLSTDSVTVLGGTYVSGQNYQRALEWDTSRRIFLQFGNGVANHIALAIDGLSATLTPVTTTGCSDLVAANAPGSAYDPVTGNTFFYLNQGQTQVFSYNPTTLVCTAIPAAAGNLVTPIGNDTSGTCPTGCGTWGRWSRVPSHPGVYIFVGSTAGKVVFWRQP